ncbi:MAG: NADPH-dependent F420 reductase [Planctomycetota bacterium]|nr:NADPH-dependent F420 reductase [Planctomycetota bacterium]
MDIAIIGSGNVGGTLARRWAAGGHTVRFGSRNPESEKLTALVAEIGDNASATTIAGACEGADVLVLATPWSATEDAITAMGDLTGRVLIDCTNPLKDDLSGLAIGTDTSGAELVQGWAPGARVVKALNTTGSTNMENPAYGADTVTMFVCGDDAEAKGVVTELVSALDFEVCDAGPLSAARYLEPTAMLWIHLAYQQGLGPNIGFRLVTR